MKFSTFIPIVREVLFLQKMNPEMRINGIIFKIPFLETSCESRSLGKLIKILRTLSENKIYRLVSRAACMKRGSKEFLKTQNIGIGLQKL